MPAMIALQPSMNSIFHSRLSSNFQNPFSFVQEEDVVTVVAAVGVALSLSAVTRIVAGRCFAAGPTGVVAVSTSSLLFG